VRRGIFTEHELEARLIAHHRLRSRLKFSSASAIAANALETLEPQRSGSKAMIIGNSDDTVRAGAIRGLGRPRAIDGVFTSDLAQAGREL
jgi:hypothetical protein